jgi:hypothetical protein
MPISPYSRYADNTVVSLVDHNGITRPTIIIETPNERKVSFSTYTWKLGDQIEYLAFSAYGDELAWWIIANANPEILFWDSLTPGVTVRVPNA